MASALEAGILECIAGKREWSALAVPNLDPSGALRGAKRVRVVVLDEDELRCPVCLSVPTGANDVGAVQLCKRGHAFCARCLPRDLPSRTRALEPLDGLPMFRASAKPAECPVCKGRVGLTPTGSMLHKTVLRSLLVTCSLGCGSDLLQADAEKHSWQCPHSTKNVCPFCPVGSTPIVMKDLLSHLEVAHVAEKTGLSVRLSGGDVFGESKSTTGKFRTTWRFHHWMPFADHCAVIYRGADLVAECRSTLPRMGIEAFVLMNDTLSSAACDLIVMVCAQPRGETGKADTPILSQVKHGVTVPSWRAVDRSAPAVVAAEKITMEFPVDDVAARLQTDPSLRGWKPSIKIKLKPRAA